ncbi:MAG TPA: hypothetical protein VGF24_21115 [Vicinamibacterales bacterium]|jgi:hypothetical protein
MHSTIDAEVAWAAFDAGTFQLRDAVPDLIAILESPPGTDARTRDYLIAAVLDALIQLRDSNFARPRLAVPSATTLERHYARWPIQVLLLMSEAAPERAIILERWLQTARGLQWYAIANLLLNEKPAPSGFANDLLNDVELRLEVDVADDGIGIGSGGGRGSGVADGFEEQPRDFPPHAVYRFESGPSANAIVLAQGPRSSYYSRRVVAEWQFFVATLLDGGPSTTDRLDYLNALVNRPHLFELRPSTAVTIAWKNERDLRMRIEAERQKIASEWQRMIASLVDGGYLRASEAAARPLPLEVEVRDQRKRPHRQLPDLTVKGRQ